MVFRLSQVPSIENLRGYPAEMIEELGQLLASGAPARLDPRREDFYEIEHDSRVFFIHVSPVNGKVLLLATWIKPLEAVSVPASHQAA